MFTYLFVAIFAGIVCKLYDDLEDNYILEKFKNSTFMEYLKGIHYICITALGIQDPLFFIFFYLGNFCNYLSNPLAFNQPYEYSLIFSFLLLVVLLDYTKITYLHIFDYFLIFILLLINFVEPIFERFLKNSELDKDIVEDINTEKEKEKKEFSYNKLYTRIVFVMLSILYCFLSQSSTTLFIYTYFTGYFFISSLIQYYSLYVTKNIIKNSNNDAIISDNGGIISDNDDAIIPDNEATIIPDNYKQIV